MKKHLLKFNEAKKCNYWYKNLNGRVQQQLYKVKEKISTLGGNFGENFPEYHTEIFF